VVGDTKGGHGGKETVAPALSRDDITLKSHNHGAGLSIAISSSTSTRGRTTAY
jgi:hypothetical protein